MIRKIDKDKGGAGPVLLLCVMRYEPLCDGDGAQCNGAESTHTHRAHDHHTCDRA